MLQRFGVDAPTLRTLLKQLNDPLTSDADKQRIQAVIEAGHKAFDDWQKNEAPWSQKPGKKPGPGADATAPAAAPGTTPPGATTLNMSVAGGSVPSNPPSPGFKPRAWRAATAPDGSRWLIDQNTGEKQPINTDGGQTPAGLATQAAPTAPAAAEPAEEDDNE
jgi:hypothetical protein